MQSARKHKLLQFYCTIVYFDSDDNYDVVRTHLYPTRDEGEGRKGGQRETERQRKVVYIIFAPAPIFLFCPGRKLVLPVELTIWVGL
jgi:hypothetical protein